MLDQSMKVDLEVASTFFRDDSGTIHCADALGFLNSLSTNVADIVFLDPPFNLGKKYGEHSKADDLAPENEYEEFIQGVLTESIRVLKPGGAFYLYHIPQWAIRFASFLSKDLDFRQWIAISMKNGFARPGYLYPAHYALLYFSKGDPNVFNRPKIPTTKCRHCDGYIKDYGGYVKYVEDGINLSDVWDDLSPVRHAKTKNRPSNELPIDLLRRVVQISGYRGGLLIDPFVGSGTSIIAAKETEMVFLANDRDETACQISKNRYLNHIGN